MNITLCILIFVKYSVKRRNTQTSDVNVSLALCKILRVVYIWLKCQFNLQSDMGVHLPCHVISPTNYSKYPQTNVCKNIKM